jgi:hypothetical protein
VPAPFRLRPTLVPEPMEADRDLGDFSGADGPAGPSGPRGEKGPIKREEKPEGEEPWGLTLDSPLPLGPDGLPRSRFKGAWQEWE